MNNLDYASAMESIFQVLSTANRYFSNSAPWELSQPTQQPKQRQILSLVFETLRICSILLWPVMPSSSDKLLDILSVPQHKRSLKDAKMNSLSRETDVSLPSMIHPLFPKRN